MEASISLLTTIVGLGLAAFALLPKEKIYKVRLYISKNDFLIFYAVFILIHYIAFFPILNSMGMPSLGNWVLGFDQQSFIYLISLTWGIYIYYIIRRDKIPEENEQDFSNLTKELFSKEYFEEIINLIEKHTSLLFKENILAITNKVFTNSKFVSFLSIRKPYFALEILEEFNNKSRWKAETYLQIYIENILEDNSSIFYEEVNELNGTYYGGIREENYQFPEQLVFLKYFLSNPRIAKKYIIYRPIGEYVIKHITKDEKIISTYNSWDRDYYDRGQFLCPVYTSINFFNIMIVQSMHTGIQWHMWLYYFDHFSKAIINKLSPNEDVDIESEFPTIFHYLLVEMVNKNLNWINEYHFVHNKRPLQWESTTITHDNGSIPKSAALNLGLITYNILTSDKITFKFKRYIFDIILREIRNFRHLERMNELSDMTVRSIIRGGYKVEPDYDYIDELYLIIETMQMEQYRYFSEALDEYTSEIRSH